MPKKKLYLMAAAITCLLLIIVFFVYRYFNQTKPVVINEPVITNESKQELTKLELQNDLNNYNQAQTTENLSLCDLIKDDGSKIFCVQELAVKTQNILSCNSIDGQIAKTSCLNSVMLASAETNQNLADCPKIESTMIQQTCVERIAEKNTKINCSLLANQDLKNICLSVIYYQQAKSENKVQICDQIPKPIERANCLSELGKIDLHSDADQDGLDFLQEIINGTNPNKADTDGDGFKDGDEVKGGFNPDGTGSLIQATPPNLISCSDIKDENIKAVCLFELKDKPLDLFKCQELKDVVLKDFCIKNLGLLTK